MARDPRVRIVRSAENGGIAWNHNRLVAEARGEYFKWAACDDRYQPTYVSACVDVLDRHPDVMLCYTNTVDIDAESRQLRAWPATNRASGDDPIERFSDVVLNEVECFLFYGLMRTDVLRSMPLLGHYSGSDFPFLPTSPCGVASSRFMSHCSSIVNTWAVRSTPTRMSATGSFCIVPARPRKMSFPRWNMARDFVEVVARSPVPFRDKVRTIPALSRWARRFWRQLVFGVPAAARYAVRHRRSQPASVPASLPR